MDMGEIDIAFKRASLEDADALIEVRNESFYADYVKYGQCPGYNCSKEEMIDHIANRISYKILLGNQIIGNMSIRDNHDGTYHLGCLCIVPDYENRGIGQKALRFLESEFKDATAWTLDTPKDNERNVHFYKKAGFCVTNEYASGPVQLLWFEKKLDR